MKRLTGTVQWFDNDKGFGFIYVPGVSSEGTIRQDVFVHYKQISSGERYKTLIEGQVVTLCPVRTDRGIQAANVVPLQE
jgi:CspA family cold shock protein